LRAAPAKRGRRALRGRPGSQRQSQLRRGRPGRDLRQPLRLLARLRDRGPLGPGHPARPGRWLGIRRHHVEIADRWFARWGLLAVFIGRLLPVVRTYISFPAGLARVPLGRFMLLTFAGALPWNLTLAWIGFTLRQHYEQLA